nr:ribonuclease H-like domain-containing protein [Tanacetum cinerariifolium]
MEAGTTATTLTAKLPILNSREYDLWLMKIEQYFLMTDYSLWEVIKNDAKLLMESIKKWYGGNKESKKVRRTLLKQQYENFAASSSESLDQTFDRLQKLISQLEIQDNLSDAVICAFLASQPNTPQLAREDLKQIDADNLEEMDLHWEMAMLTIRTRRAPKTQENRGREYGRKIVPVENLTENALIAQDRIREYDWSYHAEEEHPTNYALMALTSLGSSSSSDSDSYYYRRVIIKVNSFSPNSKIDLFLFNSNNCISSVKKGSSQDERNFAIFFYFENNIIGRKGLRVSRDSFAYKEYGIRLMLASSFGPTIKLVSFDESQVVTLIVNSFAISGIVIAEPRVRATTRLAAYMGSSSIR